jgi:hypothetical protein
VQAPSRSLPGALYFAFVSVGSWIIFVHCSYRLVCGLSGFGGAEVACWPLIPKFAVSIPAEAVGFLKSDKNPQHAFLRKGSKIIGPMSQICGMLKDSGYISQASSGRHFRP